MFKLSDKLLNIVISTQLCSTHENQELLASTVENFGAWLHAHVVHYLVEEVGNLDDFLCNSLSTSLMRLGRLFWLG